MAHLVWVWLDTQGHLMMACPDGSFGPVVTLDDMASPDGSFGPGVAQYSGTLDDMAAPMAHLVRVWLDTQRHLMI